MRLHGSHYGWLHRIPRALGSRIVTSLQNASPGLYYNTMVQSHSSRIQVWSSRPHHAEHDGLSTHQYKYGIISVRDFCDDLLNWSCLYASGRLHKPVSSRYTGVLALSLSLQVRVLNQITNQDVAFALQANLRSLVRTRPVWSSHCRDLGPP